MPKTLTECPFCGQELPAGAETCPHCDLPLAAPAGEDRGDRFPPPLREYCEGRLVRVISASNQSEAELLEGLLRSERIPCVVQRSLGSDVPDFLASGWRDVMVPESGVAAARQMLNLPPQQEALPKPQPVRLALYMFAAGMVLLAVALALSGNVN